ncbi:hypothetical protein [Yaniella halotolerans]|uniref:hypothetical protein n=1 Tax=Yaniella halotolerans TaxID=225453 RepID=UPI0003B40C9C|nr:hypothetical protein [Yaniella halotolerans]
MTHDERNRDSEWEDLVRRLGGSPEQATGEPIVESHQDRQHRNVEDLDADVPHPTLGAPGPRDYSLAEEEPLDFQPPDPKPVSASAPRTVLSWLGVISATVLWIMAGMAGWQLPWWLSAASILGFLAGVTSLFFLLPKTWAHRDRFDDDDYGSGAKV